MRRRRRTARVHWTASTAEFGAAGDAAIAAAAVKAADGSTVTAAPSRDERLVRKSRYRQISGRPAGEKGWWSSSRRRPPMRRARKCFRRGRRDVLRRSARAARDGPALFTSDSAESAAAALPGRAAALSLRDMRPRRRGRWAPPPCSGAALARAAATREKRFRRPSDISTPHGDRDPPTRPCRRSRRGACSLAENLGRRGGFDYRI